MSIKHALDRRWYPGFEDEWDARAFRERILGFLRPEMRMLDIGAGRGASAHMNFRGLAAEIVGADIDDAVLINPNVDRAVHTPNGSLHGLPDAYFDLVVSKDVMEHVEDPRQFFAEIERVLKPGGLYLGKTPNGAHYVTLIARVTPLWFHKAFNKMRGRRTIDTFQTYYLANSKFALKKWSSSAALDVVSIERLEGRPEYLRMNPLTYLLGMLYERAANALRLEGIKAVIFVTMRKPSAPKQGMAET